MKRLLRLALATDFVALMTVVLGSWTRINGAGLTCPDWPLCHGHIIPLMTDGTLWEWTHRLLAFTVAPLTIALVRPPGRCAPVRRSSARRWPRSLPFLSLRCCWERRRSGLGMRRSPSSCTGEPPWHSLRPSQRWRCLPQPRPRARDAPPHDATRSSGRLRFVLLTTTTIAFITMCIGAYVSSSGAGLACLSIQQCAGNVIVHTPGEYVQMLHRAAAATTLIFAAAALALAWAGPASARVRAAAGRRRGFGLHSSRARTSQRDAAIARRASRSACG